MRGGIAQRQERTELFQPLFCLHTFDRLRLINNEDRICFGDDVDRFAGAELVQLHINAPRVLTFGVERLRIDDHHIDGTVGGKAVDFRQLRGIVDEEADLLSVFLGKMFLRHLKGLVHSLSDRYTRYNDNKLAPSVMLVQLVHCLDICVRLAYPGLHLYGQVVMSFQLLGRLDLICPLHLLQVFQNDFVRKFGHDMLIAPTGEVVVFSNGLLPKSRPLVHHIGRRKIRLTREHVHHGFRRVRLELLMLELKFQHSAAP